jgi:hypothetical protein
MDISELMNLLQATISSVVMISSSALLCLIIQTRYGRVVDRIRQLIYDQRRLQQSEGQKQSYPDANRDLALERLRNIDAQIGLLLNRGSKLKRALFLTFSAVFTFILSSFLILVASVLGPVMIIPLVALTFFFGMLFLLLGAVTTVIEIANSYGDITKEVKSAKSEASRTSSSFIS